MCLLADLQDLIVYHAWELILISSNVGNRRGFVLIYLGFSLFVILLLFLIAVKDWAKTLLDHVDPYHLGIRFVGFLTAKFVVEISLLLLRSSAAGGSGQDTGSVICLFLREIGIVQKTCAAKVLFQSVVSDPSELCDLKKETDQTRFVSAY